MQAPATPVATTGTNPELDRRIMSLILDLAETHDLDIREATRRAAVQARDEAVAKGWSAELVDFAVIHTVCLGSRLKADLMDLVRGAAPAAA